MDCAPQHLAAEQGENVLKRVFHCFGVWRVRGDPGGFHKSRDVNGPGRRVSWFSWPSGPDA
eukprot:3064441-Amphidinium_carterae.1